MLIEVHAPEKDEYLEYYEVYVSAVRAKVHDHYFQEQYHKLMHVLKDVQGTQEDYAYDEGKWTIRQVVRHLIDTERIFIYRATAIARNEKQSLLGFDQNAYVDEGPELEASLAELLKEFKATRDSTEWFYKNLGPADWIKLGRANDAAISVRALAFIALGHVEHHTRILQERYLTSIS